MLRKITHFREEAEPVGTWGTWTDNSMEIVQITLPRQYHLLEGGIEALKTQK
jgi:hypothetical protein